MERVMSSAPEGILQHAVIDERKRKRMESNRESARRSRLRKQQCLDDLIREVSQLQQGNIQITEKINAAEQIYMEVASENNVLNAQITELTDRLQSLNEVVYFVEEASGFAMDIPEISNFLLEPWQLSCPEHTILASTNMLQY